MGYLQEPGSSDSESSGAGALCYLMTVGGVDGISIV